MSSFKFSFDKKPKGPAGTVFAKKRGGNTSIAKAKSINEINKQPKVNVKPSATLSLNNNVETKEKTSWQTKEKNVEGRPEKFNNTLVKRKQKKDKLLNKSLQKDDDVSKGVNPEKTHSSTHSLFSEKHKKFYVNTNLKGKSVVEKVFSDSVKDFSNINIHKHLISNLKKHSFNAMTNVQAKAMPAILSGKNVLIRSQTGSGKTLAYAVPILDALVGLTPKINRADGCQAIIVVPTRELALQVHELFGKLNTFQWIVASHLCGGENRKTEKDRLRKGVHILIGTPGRLLDHILHTTACKINNVRCLVLDEADRLLDMGFKKDIVRLVEELDQSKVNAEYDPLALLKTKKSEKQNKVDEKPEEDLSLPPLKNIHSKERQTLLLSATLSKGVAELADFTMKDHIFIDSLDDSHNISPEHMIIPDTVKQEFIMTFVKHRLFTLSAVLVAKAKQKSCKVFVFMATTQMVDYHHELFTKYLTKMPKNRGKLKFGEVVLLEDGIEDSDDEEEDVLDLNIFKLHGNMDQSQRKQVFNGFRAAKKGVLLCTDVAARGLDVPEADSIIQYTGPQSDEDYLHRVGRTGRAGKSGSALIFLTHEEQEYITRLQSHKVFLQEHKADDFLKHLSLLMEVPDQEQAAVALQKRYEQALQNDKDLHKKACFAYSSWSRFYNTYPSKMKDVFDFKKINLGHYVTSFGLQETPTTIARVVRGQVTKVQPRKLNTKLATHSEDQKKKPPAQKRKIKSISLTTSEFASGLEPVKKRKKKNE